jgi:hypothetical protein
VRARRRFGQHFLEPAWADRVVEVIRPAAEDVFVEIGPGRGVMTLALARRVRQLVAVEIDRDLAPALSARVPNNVRVVEADFLDVDADALVPPGVPFKVAGNLPYNISTPILFRVLALAEEGRRVLSATVMLQREVADRLSARPGTGDWGVLSACQQLRARRVPPGAESQLGRRTRHLPAAEAGGEGRRVVRRAGPFGVHAAPQDADQRAREIRHCTRRRRGGGARRGRPRRPPAPGDAGDCRTGEPRGHFRFSLTSACAIVSADSRFSAAIPAAAETASGRRPPAAPSHASQSHVRGGVTRVRDGRAASSAAGLIRSNVSPGQHL